MPLHRYQNIVRAMQWAAGEMNGRTAAADTVQPAATASGVPSAAPELQPVAPRPIDLLGVAAQPR
jgi:hypothetical protein